VTRLTDLRGLFACALACLLVAQPAHAYQERIMATIARIGVTAEQQAGFDRVIDEHYVALRKMYTRQVREFGGSELEKQVNRGIRRLSSSTEKKLTKVLRPEQMEEARYLLELVGKQFRRDAGISE
jgi:hypothetical protein